MKSNLMKTELSRRMALRLAAASAVTDMAVLAPGAHSTVSAASPDPWSQANDRTWLGGEFWANPMEDWCIREGEAECLTWIIHSGRKKVHRV